MRSKLGWPGGSVSQVWPGDCKAPHSLSPPAFWLSRAEHLSSFMPIHHEVAAVKLADHALTPGVRTNPCSELPPSGVLVTVMRS